MRFSLGGLRATRSVAEGSFDLWFLGEVEKGKPLSQVLKYSREDITLGNLPIPQHTVIIPFEYSHLKLYFKGIILVRNSGLCEWDIEKTIQFFNGLFMLFCSVQLGYSGRLIYK